MMSFALIFAGQGAQKVGMGKSLYEGSAAAKALYDEANSAGLGLEENKLRILDTELTQTKICQPTASCTGLAVVAALREAGNLPAVKFTMAWSLGESPRPRPPRRPISRPASRSSPSAAG